MPHEGSEPEQGDRLLKHAFCSSFMSLDAVYTRTEEMELRPGIGTCLESKPGGLLTQEIRLNPGVVSQPRQHSETI